MIDKLLEGKLLTLLVGAPFRLVEILVRTVHITVRGIRLLVQERVASPIDRLLSRTGKRRVASTARVDPTSVVLVQSDGEYDSDPKYIAEELLRRPRDLTLTWVLREQSVGPFPRAFRFVRYGTADYFRALAGARVVVHEGRAVEDSGAVRGPDQHWVHTGPGLAPHGHPRNDVLVRTSPETVATLRKKVLDRLGVADSGQRFLLYVASRRTSPAATLSGIDFAGVRTALSDRFGGAWEILIRTPERTPSASDLLLAGLPAFCRNASFHPDGQELRAIADAALADGASELSDYLVTRRPAFLFDPSAPMTGSLPDSSTLAAARTNADLVRAIAEFDEDRYRSEIDRLPSAGADGDDGHAAERVVDGILGLLSADTHPHGRRAS